MILIGPALMLCFPYTIEEKLTIKIFEIPVYIYNLIYIPIFIKSILKKFIPTSFFLVYFLFVIMSIGSIISLNFIVPRIILSAQFFFPFILFHDIDFDNKVYKTIKVFLLFLLSIIILQVYLFAFGIIQNQNPNDVVDQIGDFIRRGTTAGSSNFTGHIIILLFGSIFSLLNIKIKSILWILTIIAVFLTGTRGAMLGILLISIIYLLRNKNIKQIIYISTIIFLLFTILNTKFHFIEILTLRNVEALTNSDISSGRFERWENTISILNSDRYNYIFGIGGANTPYFDENWSKIPIKSSPHNVYISILLENGFLGLILFIIILLYLFSNIKVKKSFEFISLIICTIISFNTEVIVRSWLFVFFYWLLYYIAALKNEN